MPLAAALLVSVAQDRALNPQVLDLLKGHYKRRPSVDVLEAIVQLDNDRESARHHYIDHLEREPSLVAAARWINGESSGSEKNHRLVQRALDHATKPLMRYRCAACGFEATQHFWHCPGCQAWDSYSARRIEEL